MIFLADLHVHSHYSRATSRNSNLVELARWGAIKGLRVIATGDFTHPGWRQEIHDMLEEDETGLFRLKPEFQTSGIDLATDLGGGQVLFIPNVEISSIYKADGQVRKIHSLVFVPDFQAMDSLSSKLERIGNIGADGRPILGLDARDLLEIALETSPDCFVVPAHIWTPWFSVLGSKSGFCSIEECYRDLAPYVFAVETGLSSDPAMNYRLSSLDRFTLISNSDTHSPSRLGRETNIIKGYPNYRSIRNALQKGALTGEQVTKEQISTAFMEKIGHGSELNEEFLGTVEFFPEEGKYHLDGHRKCKARLDPAETLQLEEKCPVCGRPVTVGVMNRVNQLADRPSNFVPALRPPFWRMLPLEEIIGQIVGTSPTSKKVQTIYSEVIRKVGPEIPALCFYPLEELEHRMSPPLVEAIRRVRYEELTIRPGYDGEYGTVELFDPGEVSRLFGQTGLFEIEKINKKGTSSLPGNCRTKGLGTKKGAKKAAEWSASLNEEQRKAVEAEDGPILVQAGPGTGKTFTLCERICRLVREKNVPPSQIVVVTFTRKAAEEIHSRVKSIVGKRGQTCWIGTFHQLGLRIMELCAQRNLFPFPKKILGEEEAFHVLQLAMVDCQISLSMRNIRRLEPCLLAKGLKTGLSTLDIDNEIVEDLIKRYRFLLRQQQAVDMDELVTLPVKYLRENPSLLTELRSAWKQILVDEFQDVNAAQYELLKLLVGPDGQGLFAIGDPDQAIYGFRGADRSFFFKLPSEWPSCRVIHLKRNYRSQSNILDAARIVLGSNYSNKELLPAYRGSELVKIVVLNDPWAEGKYIIKAIESLMGGTSFESVAVCGEFGLDRNLSFRDFAVLYRLNIVGDTLEEAFAKSGLPYQRSQRARPEEEPDDLDPRAEAVSMMTMHASKGLEFPVVFVAGCEDGLIPYIKTDWSPNASDGEEEEQRLFYVAMTRAKHLLYLTIAKQRVFFNRLLHGKWSRFLPLTVEPPYEIYKRRKIRRRIKGPVQYRLF